MSLTCKNSLSVLKMYMWDKKSVSTLCSSPHPTITPQKNPWIASNEK